MTTALLTVTLATLGFVITAHLRVSRLGEQAAEIRGDVKLVVAAVDTVSGRVDGLTDRVDGLSDRVDTLGDEMRTGFASVRDVLAGRDAQVSGEIADIRERLARLETARPS